MNVEREKRFHELLDQVLELDSERRPAFLDRECGDDTKLRKRLEAAAALDDADFDDFFEHPRPVAKVAAIGTMGDRIMLGPETLSGPVPQIVGPYVLHEILGQGGMGRVFRAEQVEPERRIVALKLMRSSIKTPDTRRRFDAERKAVARLDHPNVGRIMDTGTTDEDHPYYAMELLDSQPITVYSDQAALGLEQRLALVAATCRGVAHAHEHRILHRDLKPSNILVVDIDGRPVPKIIDFGIATFLDQSPDDEIAIRGMTGTPVYMSPESLEGPKRPGAPPELDVRSDVYALGVLLYELLVGEQPWETKGQDATGVIFKILKETAIPPSKRVAGLDPVRRRELAASRRLREDEMAKRLEGGLDRLVSKAIAKLPADRYPSAAAFADAIEAWLARADASS